MKRRRFSDEEIELIKIILEPYQPALNKLIKRAIIIYVTLMLTLIISAIISRYI